MKIVFWGLIQSSFIFANLSEELNFSNVTFQEHGLFARVGSPDNPTAPDDARFLNSLTAAIDWGNWNVGVEVSNALTSASTTNYPAVLSKKHVTYTFESFRADLGDFNQQLGRGIALDLYRDDVFGLNNTLEGITAQVEKDSWKLMAFGGQMNALKVSVALNPADYPLTDRSVVMMGGSGAYQATANSRLGAHFFRADNTPSGEAKDKTWNTVGVVGTFDEIGGIADLYLESNLLVSSRRTGNRFVSHPNGYGSYASLTIVPPLWKLKLEAKDYRNYDFEFRRPPTLEEDIVVSVNHEDVSAARLQIERTLSQAALSASLLGGYDRVHETQLYHGVAGGRVKWGHFDYEGKMGYRLLPDDSDMKHASIKIKIPTLPTQSAEFVLRRQLENKNLRTFPLAEDRNIFEIAYSFSERWTAGIGYENVPTNSVDLGNHFFNSNLGYKKGSTSARAMVGSTSGGTRCSGGVCRMVPAFSGAMLEGYYTF